MHRGNSLVMLTKLTPVMGEESQVLLRQLMCIISEKSQESFKLEEDPERPPTHIQVD